MSISRNRPHCQDLPDPDGSHGHGQHGGVDAAGKDETGVAIKFAIVSRAVGRHEEHREQLPEGAITNVGSLDAKLNFFLGLAKGE